MDFYGYEIGDELVGVMGVEPVEDVTLIRHAYVLPDNQHRGIGQALLEHLRRMNKTTRLLVGTWADAYWAIEFYRKRGFKPLPDKDVLLSRYWDISERQIETSVVLESENGSSKE